MISIGGGEFAKNERFLASKPLAGQTDGTTGHPATRNETAPTGSRSPSHLLALRNEAIAKAPLLSVAACRAFGRPKARQAVQTESPSQIHA